MPTYTVKSPIKHGGRRVMPGESVEMAAKQAAPLLAAGDIEVPAGEKAKAAEPAAGKREK
jgi:hypothetical protein